MTYVFFGALAVMIGTYVLRWNSIPEQLPLFYSKPWGEDQLGESWMIFFLPILLIMFYLLNQFIKKKMFPDNAFIAKIFDFANIFLSVSFTIIFLKIIFLIS